MKEIEVELTRVATLPVLEALDLSKMEDAIAAQLSDSPSLSGAISRGLGKRLRSSS